MTRTERDLREALEHITTTAESLLAKMDDNPRYDENPHKPILHNIRLVAGQALARATETAAERDRLREVNAELLEALKRYVRDDERPAFQMDKGKLDAARAALAKAEGRQS